MKWEYMVLKFDFGEFFLGGDFNEVSFNKTLNDYGKRGWELVSTFDTNYTQGRTRYVVANLKRPLSDS